MLGEKRGEIQIVASVTVGVRERHALCMCVCLSGGCMFAFISCMMRHVDTLFHCMFYTSTYKYLSVHLCPESRQVRLTDVLKHVGVHLKWIS